MANGVLLYQDQRFPCHVENVSLHGALVGVDDPVCELLHQGGRCGLTLRQGGGGPGIDLDAQIVHSGFGLVGLRFVGLDATREKGLADIIEQASQGEVSAGGDASRLYARLGINADR